MLSCGGIFILFGQDIQVIPGWRVDFFRGRGIIIFHPPVDDQSLGEEENQLTVEFLVA